MESKRQRRYTIARPESALALLATEDDDLLLAEDDQQQQFDRISDILSNLIQEANQAVSLPMVRKLSSTTHPVSHYSTSGKRKVASKRPVSYPSRRSYTPIPPMPNASVSTFVTTRKPCVTQINNKSTTPALLESFKRLDSSLAIIDSLSKDLIVPAHGHNINKKQKKKHHHHYLTFDTRLSALILLPLFHIPHILISMVFDSISNNDNSMYVSPLAADDNTASFSGMLIWAFIFAVTNVIMVESSFSSADLSLSSSSPPALDKLIPGAFHVKRKMRSPGKRKNDGKPSSSPRQQFFLQKQNDCAIHTMRDYSANTLRNDPCTLLATSITTRARRNSF